MLLTLRAVVRIFLFAGFVLLGLFVGLSVALLEMRATAQPLSVHTPKQCTDLLVHVAGGSDVEQAAVCDAAGYAIARLEQCAIAQRRPINIELRDVVRDPFGSRIFGRLDLQHDVVFLTSFASLEALARDTPYQSFALAEFHRSLAVHEVVHAVMNHNYRRQPTTRAAWEYPAYAIQLESLPAETRESFLLAKAAKTPWDGSLLNDIILAFDPYYFAAMAYQHLSSSRNRCASLHEVLTGGPNFIAAIE
jgi:hypothetical protein